MQKLIFGIIAVAVLQIGFLTYITSDRSDGMLVLNGLGPTPVTTADYEVSDDNLVIDRGAANEDPFVDPANTMYRERSARGLSRAGYAGRRKSYNGVASRRLRKTSNRPQIRQPFVPEQVIITYASYKPYKFVEREREPERNVQFVNRPEIVDEPSVARIQKTQKRSFLAGALPIIKKPYEWIKALGSKLK